MSKKILVSAIQPSGQLHLGNYLGAMKQFVELQNTHDAYISVVNYHALTTVQNAEDLKKYTRDVILDYLAVGLDPEKITLFVQSEIPELPELTWIFNCLVTMPWLARAHSFKDKTERGIEASVGLYDYPVLMAADILMMDATVVPVGKDQEQHVEMAREVARKFNNHYGDTFAEPEAMILKEVAVVPGVDGQKMSKSYNNTIPLFGTDAEIKKAVMSIVTDSKEPEDKKNPDDIIVYQIYKLIASDNKITEMKKGLEDGGLGYGVAKKMLLEAILELITPMRDQRARFESNPELVDKILEEGREKARRVVEVKMKEVKEKVGL
ncbi:tryptophan--tRNA ligase [Candidatus Parcubacteria bacterium]|nr:tryptophan--tRNA ligase [Candidatus Parcubacteria bacterium]